MCCCNLGILFSSIRTLLMFVLNIFWEKLLPYLPCTIYTTPVTVRTKKTFSQKCPQFMITFTDPNVCCIKGSQSHRDSFERLIFSLAVKPDLWEIFSH